MRHFFEQEHKKRFGFFVAERSIFIEMLTVEAIGNSSEHQDFSKVSSSPKNAQPISFKKMYVNTSEKSVPIYLRSELKAEQKIFGPAIICEATGTNVVEQGWSGYLDKYQNLILSRVERKKIENGIGT